ncbi:MAG: hypothetical protein ACE5F9_15140 [Phycisphaerae bacterium]
MSEASVEHHGALDELKSRLQSAGLFEAFREERSRVAAASTDGVDQGAQDEPERNTVKWIDASRFKTNNLSYHQLVAWVAEHIAVRTEPEDCPCGKAWSLLLWVRESESNQALFWTKFWSPSLCEDEPQRFFDDGRKDLRMIEEIRRSGVRSDDGTYAPPLSPWETGLEGERNPTEGS